MTTNGTGRLPLLAILVCERVMFDDDMVPSLFRVVDEFRLEVIGKQPEVSEQVGVLVSCVVFTKWGPGEGQFTQEITIVLPDGRELRGGEPMEFTQEAGFHFHQTRHQVRFTARTEGVHSFRLYLNGQAVGEHPFRVAIITPETS